MAGINRIYGAQQQYLELKEWLERTQKPIRCVVGWGSVDGKYEYQDILPTDCLYDEDGYNEDYRPISNFPSEIDKWLIKECPLQFVRDRLKQQYPDLKV